MSLAAIFLALADPLDLGVDLVTLFALGVVAVLSRVRSILRLIWPKRTCEGMISCGLR